MRDAARGLGVGKALVMAILQDAMRLGYGEVKLDTLPKLEAAIALYRSFGFEPIAPYGSYPYPGVMYFDKTLP